MKNFILLSLFALLSCSYALDSATAAQLLQLHNVQRREIGLADLTWDSSLESASQAWADNLANSQSFHHSGTHGVGENIAESSPRSDLTDFLFGLWSQEKSHFTNSRPFPQCNTGTSEVGHYTQIMWAKTKTVGCGIATGGSMTKLVCQYSPPGNYVGDYCWSSADIVNPPGSSPSTPATPASSSTPSTPSTPTDNSSAPGATTPSDPTAPTDSNSATPSDNTGSDNSSAPAGSGDASQPTDPNSSDQQGQPSGDNNQTGGYTPSDQYGGNGDQYGGNGGSPNGDQYGGNGGNYGHHHHNPDSRGFRGSGNY